MKILYCIPWLYNAGGMERTLSTKVNYLVREMGYEVTILTTEHFNKPIFFDLDDAVKLVHLNIKQDEVQLNSSFLKRKKYQKELANSYQKALEVFLKNNAQDIIITMMKGAEFDFLPQLKDGSVKLAECHYATQFYDGFYKYNGKNLLKKIWRMHLHKKFINTLKQYHKVILLTKADVENWSGRLNNLIQIYNPLDFETKDYPDYNSKNVIAVGRLSPEKGYPEMLNIWSEVSSAFPDWILNIYGTGPDSASIEKIIQDKKLEAKVFLQGSFSPIKVKLLQHSLFIMASHKEGMGLSLVEAMACGLPVMAFDCPNGPNEIIEDGKTGYIINQYDEKEYAQKLKFLLSEANVRAEMGQMAKLKSADFSTSKIMHIWDEVFKECILEKK